MPAYDQMIRGFSPREIATMIRSAMVKDNPLGNRLANNASCRNNFKEVLGYIETASVPSGVKADYDKIMR
ncbi:hypothetical protein A3717_27920 [Alcanivorax sp. HI0013]|nr:hypothetical protein A3717_27920 [Alcanivorax sp. HI0013]